MNSMKISIPEINEQYKDAEPKEIVQWALSVAQRPIVTTNFRPYEGAILHALISEKENIKVIWCDTGYNTPQTYQHAEDLKKKLNLNIYLYVPKQTVGHRQILLGIPSLKDPKHKIFTEQVKLEPFTRALKEHTPDVWFTNLRKGQTSFRDTINIVSESKEGILKICPFYHWSDQALDSYLLKHNLPNEHNYFDPTKMDNHRECGLHA